MERGDPYKSWTTILAFFQSQRALRHGPGQERSSDPPKATHIWPAVKAPPQHTALKGTGPPEAHRPCQVRPMGLIATVSVHGVAVGNSSASWHLQSCTLAPNLQLPWKTPSGKRAERAELWSLRKEILEAT